MEKVTRRLIEVEVRLGFLYIPAHGLDLMPDESCQIKVLFKDTKEGKKLKYNTDYKRIFGLTPWYRKNKVKVGDEILIQRTKENTYQISLKKEHIPVTDDQREEKAKELIDLSGLSSTAKGDIVEDRIKELVLLHGQGLLNVYKPVSDTEGVDLIVVKNGMFQPIFIQVKGRFTLTKQGAFLMDIRLKTFNPHHSYYVVGAFFNQGKLEIDDYILLIPTKVIKNKAVPIKAGKEKRFRVATILNPKTKSKWGKYIIKKTELANILIEKFEEMSTYLK